MPAGVTWPTYLKALVAVSLAMAAGSQTVHIMYRPLDDLSVLVKQEKERILQFEKEELEKIHKKQKEEQKQISIAKEVEKV